jgi:hypothetical protein
VRYKVTVVVEEGSALRVGSAIWSWTLSEPRVAMASPYNGRFRGEAVAVDLSGGRTLFAILRGQDTDQGAAMMLPERFFGDIWREARGEPKRFGSDRIADIRDIASRLGERRVLDCAARPGWCPMLVRFATEGDPKSVTRVDPSNLEASFGADVKLNRITVEITNEPVTVGIEEELPSYGPETGFSQWYRSLPYGDPRAISRSDFQRRDN